MDFFTEQDAARQKTRWLLVLFLLCVCGVVVGVGLITWGVTILLGAGVLPWEVVGAAGLFTAVLILASSGFKGLQLRGGGGVVARDLGGRLIEPSTTHTHERKLLNVVEEMSIASGVPVPQVYVMDEEEGINAFAAGTEPGNAAIGVTRGCMMLLNRSELQGVIAHEFSHILNGDMKLNMRLIGWVFGLVVISILGRGLLESLRFVRVGGGGRRDSNGGGAILLAILAMGVGLLIVGSVGTFFARLLQAAVSRQREFLADASAVQFTRDPSGLSGALKKIGGQGSKISNAKASEASHCFFADGGLFAFGFATHPPLPMRISKLEREWDGKFKSTELPPIAEGKLTRESPPAMSGVTMGLAGAESTQETKSLSSSERVHLERGREIRKGLSKDWKLAVRDREEAQALVFGLLLAQDNDLLESETAYLQKQAGVEAAALARRWHGELFSLHSARKIALVDVAVPTLRTLSRPEYERFVAITRELIGSDGRVNLFEYMLQRLIDHHLEVHFGRKGFGKVRYSDASQLKQEAQLLYSAFAHLSEGVEASYLAASRSSTGPLLSENSISLREIDQALKRLELASPLVKRDILNGCARAVASDGAMSSREAELLRAMADGLGCAVPPFVSELKEVE